MNSRVSVRRHGNRIAACDLDGAVGPARFDGPYVTEPGDVVDRHRQPALDLPDAFGPVIVERDAAVELGRLGDSDVELGVAEAGAGPEASVEAVDQRILEEHLESLLQGMDVERRLRTQRQPVPHILRAEIAAAGHGDFRRRALDEGERDDAVAHLLIRQDRAGTDVAGVDIEPRHTSGTNF